MVPKDDQAATRRFAQKLALWEPHIQAFVDTSPFPAEHEAAPKEATLSGLTVGVKDIINVAGMATRNGSATCKDAAPAARDATVVAALRTAGAQIVGKTTTTEFAFTDPTPCRNPFDLSRTPGGSSSGSGAAVAAGVVDIALGTQTAGSLCRPAAYCGAVGFKPSYGALPTDGVTSLAPSFDSVGIIAGSVSLVGRAFAAMASCDDTVFEGASPRLLCGLWAGDVAPCNEVQAAYESATQACEAVFAVTRNSPLPADVQQIIAAHRVVMNYEAAQAHGAMLSDHRADLLKPKFRAGLQAGALISAQDAAQANGFLCEVKAAFWADLGDVDAVLTLPVPDGAPLIEGTTGFQDWLTPWTVFGGPLICLPWGVDRLGRPRSVMLAGRPGQDAQLLAIAAKVEAQGPTRPLPLPPSS